MMLRHREIPDFVYDPSLVLYIPLWKRDGATFISDDAYGHLATVTGATWGTQGRTFNGTSDDISVPDADSLDITTAITVGAWVYWTGQTGYGMIAAKKAAGDATFTLYIDDADDSAHFQVIASGGSPDLSSGLNGITKNAWHHVFGAYNGVDVNLYVDNVSYTTTTSGTLTTSTEALTIGKRGTFYLAGTIGEIWIYNRALTAAEIQQNYLGTRWRYR